MDFFKSWDSFFVPALLLIFIGGLWVVAFAEPMSTGYAAVVVVVHDAKVKSDLAVLSSGLEAYYTKNHTYVIPGAGFAGEGEGWVAIKQGTSSDALYTASIIDKLREGGFLKSTVNDDASYTYLKDPTPRNYMLYICDGGQAYALSATLQNPSTADIAKQKASCNARVSSKFAKNYVVTNSHVAKPTPASRSALPFCTMSFNAQTSTLYWHVDRATTVILRTTQSVLGTVAASSSKVLPPNISTTYVIAATNASGSSHCSLQIAPQQTASATTALHVVRTRPSPTSPTTGSSTSTESRIKKVLAEMAVAADSIGRGAPVSVSSYINGYVTDIHTANANAKIGAWSKIAPALESATAKIKQANAILPRTSFGTIPNPSYSATKNAIVCGRLALNKITQTRLYEVRYLVDQVVATSSMPLDLQQGQAAYAQAIQYETCFNTYKQQVIIPAPATFTASPLSGVAPLVVNFSATNLTAGDYNLNFGDSVIQLTSSACLQNRSCPRGYTYSHTYTTAGTYTVKLVGTTRTVTITVSAPTGTHR